MTIATVPKTGRRILRVQLLREIDTDADTSYVGEYTDHYLPEAIVCHTGEFVADIERRQGILDELSERQYEAENAGQEARARHYHRRRERLAALWEDKQTIPNGYGNTCRFFVPYAAGEKVGTAGWREYARKHFERAEHLNKGDWWYIGIRAVADVQAAHGAPVQRLTSAGLWGIESDSDPEYLAEVESEELRTLEAELTAYGFSARAARLAIAKAERKDA